MLEVKFSFHKNRIKFILSFVIIIIIIIIITCCYCYYYYYYYKFIEH